MANRIAAAIYVGIFTIAGTIVLLYVSLQAGANETVSNPRRVVADFSAAKGLAVGADVRFLGVRVGLVRGIELADRSGQIVARVAMDIDSAVAIKEDSRAFIVPATLLGNYMVNFEGGSPDSPDAAPERPLMGSESTDINEVIERIGEGIDEIRELAQGLDGNQANVFAKLEAVIDENRENIKTATDSLAEIGPKLDDTVNKIASLVDDASEGEGTLGMLLSDAELGNRIDSVTQNLDSITAQIASGEGTLGKLVYTEEGLQDIKQSLEEMQQAFNDIREVLDENRAALSEAIDGLQGVGPAVDAAAKNLQEITEKINSGEGTLGRFINDPDLYDEATQAFTQIQQTFEEAEEQTVLQSFLRIFTGAI